MMLSRRMLMAAAGANYTPTPPAPTPEWWEAGGVTGAVQVLSGLYAADKAASLLDLSSNGNNATEGGTVTWGAQHGWSGLSASNFVNTGLVPVDGETVIISYAGGATGSFLMGAFDGATLALTFNPGNTGVLYWAGANQATRGANHLNGVLAMADAQPYRNGLADGADLGAWGGAPAVNITLGKLNGYVPAPWSTGTIRRYARYDHTLSDAEVKAVSRGCYDLPIFFGDSITGGTGASDAAHRWVDIVAAAQDWGYFRNHGDAGTVVQNTVQNATSTIGAAADGNARDTYILRLVDFFPNHILILYGLNDLRLNDVAFTAANYENDLGEIVAAMIADGVPADNIVIGSPPYMDPSFYASYSPFNGGSTMKHEDYVAAAAAVASANDTRYVDIYQEMLDNGDDSLLDADGIHPNDSGHAVIAAAFIAALA